ncbi:MAG: hypothetical protein OEY52_00315 [Gammaproteobacteria bacterium]|nr:hypothetical protein [Gammaproteobacteria bacterium]
MYKLIIILSVIIIFSGCQIQTAQVNYPVHNDKGRKVADCTAVVYKKGGKQAESDCKKTK